jgi:hypothetical protein
MDTYTNSNIHWKRYSVDPNIVRNRADKSLLVIRSSNPQELLDPTVAFPDQVKYLLIDTDYDWQNDNIEPPTDLGWVADDTFKDLSQFRNLEYLRACGLTLNKKYWIEFSKNSTKLKEIRFENAFPMTDEGDCKFNFDEEILEVIFKIPTLEKVTFEGVFLPCFPPGPSNIQDLRLTLMEPIRQNFCGQEEKDMIKSVIESYSKNLCTHTNLKKLYITQSIDFTEHSSKPIINVGKHCLNLEELSYGYFRLDVIETLETLMQLPKLKKLYLGFWPESDEFIRDKSLVFPSVEYLNLCCGNLSNETISSTFGQFPNLKSCIVEKTELVVS